ncbi:MAG: hypothetical protein ACO3ZZ_06320, partial [Solirubrobacterales bacterium]
YADGYQEMTTEYGGNPVDGGTYPAIIWARVIDAWKAIQAGREAEAASEENSGETTEPIESTGYATTPVAPAPAAPTQPTAPAAPAPAPAPGGSGGASAGSSGGFSP